MKPLADLAAKAIEIRSQHRRIPALEQSGDRRRPGNRDLSQGSALSCAGRAEQACRATSRQIRRATDESLPSGQPSPSISYMEGLRHVRSLFSLGLDCRPVPTWLAPILLASLRIDVADEYAGGLPGQLDC